MERLGEKLTLAAFSVRGILSASSAWDLVWKIVEAIGMTAAPGSSLQRYPLPGGKGGQGFTIYQPITESFIALDNWEEFAGCYLVVCSCKHFSIWDIEGLIEKEGYLVTGNLLGTLGLKP